jgi:hypothetical protein
LLAGFVQAWDTPELKILLRFRNGAVSSKSPRQGYKKAILTMFTMLLMPLITIGAANG